MHRRGRDKRDADYLDHLSTRLSPDNPLDAPAYLWDSRIRSYWPKYQATLPWFIFKPLP
jgi:hypothetical protein